MNSLRSIIFLALSLPLGAAAGCADEGKLPFSDARLGGGFADYGALAEECGSTLPLYGEQETCARALCCDAMYACEGSSACYCAVSSGCDFSSVDAETCASSTCGAQYYDLDYVTDLASCVRDRCSSTTPPPYGTGGAGPDTGCYAQRPMGDSTCDACTRSYCCNELTMCDYGTECSSVMDCAAGYGCLESGSFESAQSCLKSTCSGYSLSAQDNWLSLTSCLYSYCAYECYLY